VENSYFHSSFNTLDVKVQQSIAYLVGLLEKSFNTLDVKVQLFSPAFCINILTRFQYIRC